MQGDTFEGSDPRVKAKKVIVIVTVMSKKRSSLFEKKINKGDTAELATKKGRQVFQ